MLPDSPPSPTATLPDPATEAAALLQATTHWRRSFVGLGLAGLAGLAGERYLLHTPEADGIPSGLRGVLDFDARLTSAYYRNTRLAPEFARSRAPMPRANGDAGLNEEDFDPAAWQLTVQGYAPAGSTARRQSVTWCN